MSLKQKFKSAVSPGAFLSVDQCPVYSFFMNYLPCIHYLILEYINSMCNFGNLIYQIRRKLMAKPSQKILSIVMSAALLSATVAGCGKTNNDVSSDNNSQVDISASQTSTESTDETTALSTEEAADTQEAAQSSDNDNSTGFPMDPSVMTPWINSTIIGMVTEDVNPDLKDDFYLNVNHDWLMNATLRPGYPTELPLLDAAQIVEDRCLEIIKDTSLTGEDAERIQNYYELWLDWDGRNKTGIEPILPFVEKVRAISSLDEMSKLLVSEDNFTWGASLARVGLSLNSEDSSLIEVAISPTSLQLGDPAEYKELTENGKRVQKANREMSAYMLGRIGMSDEEIEKTLQDMYDFEAKLAVYEKTYFEQSDSSYIKSTINPVTMQDIKTLSPSYPLAEYMENYGWAKSKLINLNQPDWLKGLNEVYTEENLDGIKAYVLVNSVKSLITCSDEEAFREYQRITREQSGTTESMSDEQLAYSETRSRFQGCFGRIYKEKYLTKEMKDEITKLCQDSIDAYDEMFDSVDWLSEETKKEAKNKLHHMRINAVYPDKWDDDSMYVVTSKKDGGTYLQAILDYSDAARADYMDMLETNAFYNPKDNSINIIPGFFCDASYRSDMSLEEKYGALGSVIGHEISHAFDTSGAQFDAYGNLKSWWTDEDYAAFSQRADKLVAYYDKVVAFDDGTQYKGQMVQTEAIADMAGIKCMLMMASKIDGFDYDKFFRANAYLWARTGTVEYMEAAVLTDSHPLHYLRANVTLAQYDEFVKCYDLKEGDGMYIAPEDRIAVW